MLEAHVRPPPVLRLRALAAFAGVGRLVGVGGLEMRLADIAGRIARLGEAAGVARLARGIGQVDAVVRHAVRARQQAGQDRGARRLAHQVGRDAGREARAVARQHVEMRRLHLAALEAVAIGALLVGGDEQDIHGALLAQSFIRVRCRPPSRSRASGADRCRSSAEILGRRAGRIVHADRLQPLDHAPASP